MSERNLKYCLRRLEEMGEIETKRGMGRGNLTVYKVIVAQKRGQPTAPFIDTDMGGVAQHENGKAESYVYKKGQSTAPFTVPKRGQESSEKGQDLAQKGQNSTVKGAKSVNAYKEVESSKESSKESSGESAHAPEPPFSSSSDTHVDEMTLGDAILEVLPSLQMNYSAQLQACQLAMNLQATVKDIQRWPRWFQTRYPGAIKNHFKFQDTFADMIRETAEKTAGYWFVFYACGHKDGAELSAKADQEIKREADWLDSQVGDTEKATWKARGLLPQHFRKYWNDSLKYPGFPSPEKVRTYWTQFTEWVVKQNGSLR